MSGWKPPFPSKRAYTFQPGSDFPASRILLWDNNTPDGGNSLLVQMQGNPNDPTSVPIREIYLPIIFDDINFYIGQQTAVGGTIDYVALAPGCECVDFDAVYYVLLQYAHGYPGKPAYVFIRNLPTGAFRTGPLSAGIASITASTPIIISGPPTTPNISFASPLAIGLGGTGTSTPALVAGPGITITGTPFNWTITAPAGGTVQSVGATDPIHSSGGNNPIISITDPLTVAHGGTGQTAPALNAGTGMQVTGIVFDPGSWTVTNIGVTSLEPGNRTGDVTLESSDGSLTIASAGGNSIDLTIANPIGFSIAKVVSMNAGTINGAGQSMSLGTLPAGTWFVEAVCHGFGFTGSTGTIAMAGTGGMSSDGLAFLAQTRTLYAATILHGGDNPGVTVSGVAVNQNGASTDIACTLKAIRTA